MIAKRLWEFARPHLPTYLAGFGLLALTNGLSLWIPWLLRDAINAMEQGVELRRVAIFAAWMTAVALGQAVARTVSRWTILGNSRRIVFEVREGFFRQLQRLGASYFDTHRTGDIMSRGVNDIRLLQGFYGPGVLNLFNTSIVYVAVLVLLLRIDARLTLISLMLYPLLFLAVNRVSRRVYNRSLDVQRQLAVISNQSQENISGIQQVKTYVQEDRQIAAFRELCVEFRERNLALARLRGGMVSLIGVVTGVGTLIVLYLGGRYVIEGRMSFGDFVAFNAYLGLLVWPTIALGWIINTFQRGAGAVERLNEVLTQEPDIPPAIDEPTTDATTRAVTEGRIEIRDLTFVHDGRLAEIDPSGERIPALSGVDLEIPAGSRVALVGPVGSGKSTLANLLARVYPAPTGTIFVDGRDVTTIPVGALRRSIGYVPQEAFLFSRSLRDNVAFGVPDAPETALARAVEVSHLAADLGALPEGLDTTVGERGFTLSGGQRQRATLARAIVTGAPILILDDSLSSVDADTEREILAHLDEEARGRTWILISHRLSTLSGMDRIVVLDAGRVVEQGSHDELLSGGGLYAEMFRRRQIEESMEGR